MVSAAQAHQNVFAIPPAALAQWRALSEAIDAHGPPVCADAAEPEAWWQPARFDEAVEGCQVCPVASECLAFAVAADEREGVWGGQLPTEREQYGARSSRRRKASA